MNDSEKVALISKIIADYWEYNSDEQMEAGAVTVITAINSVIDFGTDQTN